MPANATPTFVQSLTTIIAYPGYTEDYTLPSITDAEGDAIQTVAASAVSTPNLIPTFSFNSGKYVMSLTVNQAATLSQESISIKITDVKSSAGIYS